MKAVLTALALLAAAPALAEACPPAPDIAADLDSLIDEARAAPTERFARPVAERMWALWTQAPDARAQEMLDQGMARIRRADYPGAVAALDDLVAYCPDYAEGYNQRAFANFLQGNYRLALADLDLALERAPRHVAAMSGKAMTLFGLGELRAGQEVLREALELNPWLSERALLDEPPGEEL
ncbi:tetratricopeptide repeat protein [Palleronia sp. KMU-117]|uniref:tetratricopeptide repeat protein n=1 Tax=Palleronia sp. KMU-117 TaxID=3434108 RepID=UPI003D71537F